MRIICHSVHYYVFVFSNIQALILKKPAMLVNLVSKLNFLGLKDIPFATTVEDLSKNMELMLSKKFIKNFELNDYCYPLGRESISLITDLSVLVRKKYHHHQHLQCSLLLIF